MKSQMLFPRSLLLISVFLLSGCSLFQPFSSEPEGWVDWDGRGGWSESSSGDEMLAAEGSGPAFFDLVDAVEPEEV